MIPILYSEEEASFTTEGIGRLVDCISCKVTNERNGVYECEFQYPITGARYSDIQEKRIILVRHDDSSDLQPFDIYARTAPLNGIVTFYAHHISYRQSNIIVGPFQASGISAALSGLKSNSLTSNPFTFWTDRSTTGTFTVKVPSSLRALLGGTSGSILDTFGPGDYVFDKWAVRLYADAGSDNGVTIRYGKNLTDLTQEYSREGMYTAVAPYWQSSDGSEVVTIPGLVLAPSLETKTVVWTDENGDSVTDEDGNDINIRYAIIQAMPMDLSGDFEEAPTQAELKALAQKRLNNSSAYAPKETLTVDFAHLWQTEEYKNVAQLERVALFDTVTVIYDALGVNTSMKVVKVVYDVLMERYDKVELGTPKTTLAQTINTQTLMELEKLPTRSFMADAIDHATSLITGGMGGYVVIGTDSKGQPEEILIMDAPDTASAVNVWRFNKGGLGHSHSGYNGPYNDIALTMDGQINANAITTGQLDANLLKAGIIQAHDGENYWNLDDDELVLKRVKLNITTDNSSYDVLTINGSDGQWQNRITPLEYYLKDSTDGTAMMIQAGGIWTYFTPSGGTMGEGFILDSDGSIWWYDGSGNQLATFQGGNLWLNGLSGSVVSNITGHESRIAALEDTDTWTSTAWAGLTCKAYKKGGSVMITLRGTTTGALGTQSSTVAVCTLPAKYCPVVTHTQYVIYGAEYKGQLVLNTDGTVNIGYTRKLTGTANENIPASTNIYITATFVTA